MANLTDFGADIHFDDASLISCTIEKAESTKGYTEYIIRVDRGFGDCSSSWIVKHRFKDFVQLTKHLSAARLNLPLPPKKLFGNLNQEFISERLHALQEFLNVILAHPYLSNSLAVKKFLDPRRYISDFQSQSLQSVSVCLRNLRGWKVCEPWNNIGWRCSKQYYLVQPCDGERRKDVLSWCSYGPDWCLDVSTTQSVLQFLASIRHPYIQIPLFTWASEAGNLTVRQQFIEGTLRDQICRAKPNDNFQKKYCNPETVFPLEFEDVKYIGRHILEALRFLHRIGLPACQLHCGNLSISSHGCELTDIEGGILGLSSFYRPFMVQLKAITTIEEMDVYCFSQCLYEMATGEPLHQAQLITANIDCDRRLRPLILSLLSPDVLNTKLPSVDDLINDDVFRTVPIIKSTGRQYSMSGKVKRALDQCRAKIEERFKIEQIEFRRAIKSLKFQAYVNSEEQRKERRKIMKQWSKTGTLTTTDSNASLPDTVEPEEPSVSAVELSESSNEVDETPSGHFIPPPPPPPPPPVPLNVNNSTSRNRSDLLQSIEKFSKNKLRKVDK